MNPGARQLAMLGFGEDRGAVFSACAEHEEIPNGCIGCPACRLWRYRLWRRWGKGQHVLWVLANPSTADEHVDDQTMRKCQSYARAWGFDGIEVVNIFAWRSTDPTGLIGLEDPVGPENDAHIVAAASSASLIVAAWGVGATAFREPFAARAAHVRKLLGPELRCLRRTKSGAPEHPLYIPMATALEPL